ncbi:MAG: helix-turn-helix transcriptional regulator [Lachnospiraceae bacterium]|nr:helix-turn-helix transcriptional regulator [Lachnospiraceae bacterium]
MERNSKETIIFDTASSVQVTRDQTPEIFPPHWHNAAEFTVALKDGCRYKVGDTSYKLNTGDILLVWPGQIHETVKIPSKGAVFIQFSALILENNMDLLSISGFLYDHHLISASENPKLAKYISGKISEIEKIHSSGDPFSETKCKGKIYEILLKLGEIVVTETGYDSNTDDPSKSGWQYIHAACNYIAENSANDISQTIVADHIGISTFYFSKLFKQYMHTSFPAYLASIRVKSASSLLMDKNLSITDCAFMSGFQSTTTFNKVFREVTGYSPRDYRKLYR